MKETREQDTVGILPVPRPKGEAMRLYDRIVRVYDWLSRPVEGRYSNRALERLSAAEGEAVLEIGFGTGHCLGRLARSVGSTGGACGIDISCGMLKTTRKRLAKAGLTDRADLCCGDAAALPYKDGTFDAAFMSFTLELFDTPEIPVVLQEVKRVLKPGGRLGVVSLSKEDGETMLLRLYERVHRKWPKYVDCRPILLEQALLQAGYKTASKEKGRLFGLPMETVVGVNMG